jgi:MEKHLA domain
VKIVWLQPEVVTWTQILLNSYRQLLGQELLERSGSPAEQSQKLSIAPWAIVSHGTEPDPILNYGNRIALELWEMDWPSFTATASRQTAELINQVARQQMLEQVQSQGFVKDYQGIRISRSGRRFAISNGIVWNLQDQHGKYCGQAATFDRWQFL